MKEKNKSCFDNFLFVIAFFCGINVEARSVRNMSAYPAKHGQSFCTECVDGAEGSL